MTTDVFEVIDEKQFVGLVGHMAEELFDYFIVLVAENLSRLLRARSEFSEIRSFIMDI